MLRRQGVARKKGSASSTQSVFSSRELQNFKVMRSRRPKSYLKNVQGAEMNLIVIQDWGEINSPDLNKKSGSGMLRNRDK